MYWVIRALFTEVCRRGGTPTAWNRHVGACSFTSPISTNNDLMCPSKISAHATWWGPAKVLPNGSRTCQGRPWLQDVAFKSWIVTYMADSRKAYCKVCNGAITTKHCDLRRHAKSNKALTYG